MAAAFEFDTDVLWTVPVSSVLVLIWAIVVIRLIGLRSLSKMSSFDFVVTVALGSIVGSTAAASTPLLAGVLAFLALLAIQWTIAQLRFHVDAGRFVDNEPLLLMYRGNVIEEHLSRSRVTRDDLRAKLRQANVDTVDDVHAVVMETTGDISVLSGSDSFDERLLAEVRRSVEP